MIFREIKIQHLRKMGKKFNNYFINGFYLFYIDVLEYNYYFGVSTHTYSMYTGDKVEYMYDF